MGIMVQNRRFLNGIMSTSTLCAFFLIGFASFTVCAKTFNIVRTTSETGPRLLNPHSVVKEIFPNASHVRESSLLPSESGGNSLVQLVARLLGEAPLRETEGLNTRRYIYHIYAGKEHIGVAHGAMTVIEGRPINSFVFYEDEGAIRKVLVENLPEKLHSQMQKHLAQFAGLMPEDFEILRGKRGRVKSRGSFFTRVQRPANPTEAQYFEKIARSVRFNAAFMDVAHFIIQYSSEDSSERIIASEPVSGPEAFIKKLEAKNAAQKAEQSVR